MLRQGLHRAVHEELPPPDGHGRLTAIDRFRNILHEFDHPRMHGGHAGADAAFRTAIARSSMEGGDGGGCAALRPSANPVEERATESSSASVG